MKYFISYTTRDKIISLDFLTSVNDMFSEYGEVYIDLLHNNSINKQQRVFEELEKCDEIILIETESVFKSDWVKIEIEKAKELQKTIRKFTYAELIQKVNKGINNKRMKVIC
ncbi:hypothetical protein CXF68_00250 [Tenacibaculum sp. Bg11-29]|uniref:hypothetical protein n=1 Tax=Tenacibaculum sp. Bg11-29 TaxID=2058306 RepID=UPI000C31D020|nr:hypothetical protein [Tenacibaculum sp. Bg11-29]PKH49210.1 hypothetical protein CXF68_00250 [Tenacibaculum sp. Bg11-29]